MPIINVTTLLHMEYMISSAYLFKFNSHTNFIYINDVIRTATPEGMREVSCRNSIFWYISATRESTVCIHTCVRVLSGAPEREKQEGPSIVPWGESSTFAGVPYPECLYHATLRSDHADGKFRPSSLSYDETNRQRRGVDTIGVAIHRAKYRLWSQLW